MTDFLQHSVTQALARALVHFVWQGAAIGLAALVAFRVARQSASARYAIGVGALVAMLAAPVGTFFVLASATPLPVANGAAARAPESVAAGSLSPAAAGDAGVTAADPNGRSTTLGAKPDWLGVAAAAWLAGVLFFSFRLAGGWVVARRYAERAVQPASEHIQALARQVADRLDVQRAVTIVQSAGVMVPVMIGWLKPTIVLPMAALMALSPAQVEALLAHELAHVRRHDYLVNLLQSVTEALLFYHPAVWWLSRRVRAERELCCDDLALGVCDRLVYATALTDLAGIASPGVALAATDGDLIGRVRRILGHGETAPVMRAGAMPVLALLLVAALGVPVALASTSPHQSGTGQAPPAVVMSSASDAEGVQGHGTVQQPPPAAQVPTETVAAAEALKKKLQHEGDLRKHLEEVRARIDHFKLWAEGGEQAAVQSEAAREAELVAARRSYEEARKRFEVGLISESQLLEAKAALAKVEALVDRTTLAHVTNAAQASQAAARAAEIEAARKGVDDAIKRYEMGLISQSQLREVQAALAKVEGQGHAGAVAAAELVAANARLERAQVMFERGLLPQGDVEEMRAALAKLQTSLSDLKYTQVAHAAAAANAKNQAEARVLHDLPSARQAAQGADAKQLEERLHALVALSADRKVEAHLGNLQHLGPAALVQAGDVLQVAIKGEPDLPATYHVSQDGTIRLLFVGAIKVVGLTAAQVRDAIGRQLSAKKLGSIDQVTVTVGRPGRPE